MRRGAALAAALWAAMPGAAAAGASDAAVRVLDFAPLGPGAAVAALAPAGVEAGWIGGDCGAIALEIRWRPEPFWRRTWSRVATRERHEAALARLAGAAGSGAALRLGAFGALTPAGDCAFAARGLGLLPSAEGGAVVMAFDGPV
jgi:hypothetical protein